MLAIRLTKIRYADYVVPRRLGSTGLDKVFTIEPKDFWENGCDFFEIVESVVMGRL